jgi:ATP synthase protein I
MEAPKGKKKNRLIGLPEAKSLAVASSIGLSMVISIFLGLGIGYYLDKWLGTKPWLLLGGLLVGIVAAFNNLIILTKRLENKRIKSNGRDEEDGKRTRNFDEKDR